MKHLRPGLLLLALNIACVIGLHPQDNPCETFKTDDARTLRDFLQEQQGIRTSPCLPMVIKRLGQLRDVDAVPILIAYMDYMDPKTGPLPGGGATERPSYPAGGALFQIGKPAALQLLSAIQGEASPQFHKNAVDTYSAIFRDDLSEGIRALKTAELLAKTEDERHRLNDARQVLMNQCSHRDEQQSQACKSAALG